VTLTFNLLTLKLLRNVARVMGYPPANFGDTTTIRFRFIWANTAQTDHVTLWPWPLTLGVMTPVVDAGSRLPCVYHVLSSYTLAFGRYGARCASALMGLVTLTFWPWNWLVCESHLRWGTFFPNLGTLDSWVLELFAKFAICTRRTDGRTDYGRGHNNATIIKRISVRALLDTVVQ